MHTIAIVIRNCFNLYYKNVYEVFLSETTKGFDAIVEQLRRETLRKSQPKKPINKL